MSILALFATFMLFSCASTRKYCCQVERYSANSQVTIFRDGGISRGTGEVYYDYGAGIHAAFVNITINEYKGIFSLISTHYDVNSGMVYTMTGGVCTKQKLDTSFVKETDEPRCIPDNANLQSTFSLGGPHEDVEMQRFLQTVGITKREIVVTKHHCYPVQEIFLATEKTTKGEKVIFSTITTMSDMKLSIADPSVLVIPDICQKSTLSTEELPIEPLKFIPFMASL